MNSSKKTGKGFSLVEVAFALGLMAFCLLSLFGLVPAGLNSNRTTFQQTTAVNIVSAIHADLRATPAANAASTRFAIPMASGGVFYFNEDGTKAARAEARFRVAITLTPPAANGRNATTSAILVSWPAEQDDPAKAVGTLESFVALDRN